MRGFDSKLRKGKRKTLTVPGTALKVERVPEFDGELVFSINKNHRHYLQMQHQIYCSNAIRAIYIVKFEQDILSLIVEKDSTMCAELHSKQLQLIEGLPKMQTNK